MTGKVAFIHRFIDVAVLIAGANTVKRAVQYHVVLAQRGNVVQRQIAGGIIAAVAHLVVIDPEVIVQGAAKGVDAGLTDIFAARAQHRTQRLFFYHQLQKQLAQAEL